jgi:hypothetical protein
VNADEEAANSTAAAAARLLDAACVPLAASGALAVTAFAALAVGARAGLVWWSIVVLAGPAAWIGMRVRFDAGLFRDLARTVNGVSLAARLAALDAALAALGLVRRPGERPLAERVRGARRLVLWQLVIAALQFGLALVAVWPTR